MKTFIIASLAVFVLIFSSCFSNQPISKDRPANNETYNVEYLFEHDGCKVYRFYDRGYYVYFTNCKSDVTAIKDAQNKLMESAQKLFAKLYEQAQAAQGAAGAGPDMSGAQNAGNAGSTAADDDIIDGDYREV